MNDIIPWIKGLPFNEEFAEKLGEIKGSKGKERDGHTLALCPVCNSGNLQANITRCQTATVCGVFYLAKSITAEECTASINLGRLKQVEKVIGIQCGDCERVFSPQKFVTEHQKRINKLLKEEY